MKKQTVYDPMKPTKLPDLSKGEFQVARTLTAGDLQRAWVEAKDDGDVYISDLFFDKLIEKLKLYPVSKRG